MEMKTKYKIGDEQVKRIQEALNKLENSRQINYYSVASSREILFRVIEEIVKGEISTALQNTEERYYKVIAHSLWRLGQISDQTLLFVNLGGKDSEVDNYIELFPLKDQVNTNPCIKAQSI